jgi:hypothetical protein
MYSQKGNSIIILVLAIALIAVGGASLLNQKYKFIKLPSIEISKTSSDTIPYTSPKFKYKIEYSKIFSFSEDPESGIVLLYPSDKPAVMGNQAIMIAVRHKSGDEETSKRPLAEYAKTGATEEIQNYDSLNSIETVTTKNGEIGYKTTWNRTGPYSDVAEINTKHEPSDPITYFGFPKDPYYTAQFFLYDQKYMSEYDQLLKSFTTNK